MFIIHMWYNTEITADFPFVNSAPTISPTPFTCVLCVINLLKKRNIRHLKISLTDSKAVIVVRNVLQISGIYLAMIIMQQNSDIMTAHRLIHHAAIINIWMSAFEADKLLFLGCWSVSPSLWNQQNKMINTPEFSESDGWVNTSSVIYCICISICWL